MTWVCDTGTNVNERSIDIMTTNDQSCLKEFARYSILSVLGTLGVSCYILADTFFIAKGLGTNGLAALNLAIPVYNFIHGTGLMLGMGGATKFTICKSQRHMEKIDQIYSNTVYLAGIFAMIFLFIGIFFSQPLALLLGAKGEVLAMTDTYLRWLLTFAPAFIMNDVLLCFVRNDGSPQLSMAAMLVGSFGNIILDYIFIFPMKMGIFGAILATGFSPIISMIMMLPHWLKKKNEFHFIRTGLDFRMVRQNLSLGFPSLIAQLSSGIVMITFNAIILSLEGNTGVAAYGVVANISLVIVAVYTGISQGVQPLISNYYGTGDREHIRRILRYAMVTTAVISCLIYAVVYFFADPVAGVFNSEGNLRLQQIAVDGLKLYFTSNLFVGFNIVIAIFFTSTEKTIPAHVLSLLRGLVLIVPLSFLLSAVWGMTGVWLTYPLTELSVAVLGCLIYLKSQGVLRCR